MPAAQQPHRPSSPLTATQIPSDVPAALFADDEREQRWRQTVFRRAGAACRTGPGTLRSAPVTSPTRPAGTRCPAGTSPATAHGGRPIGPTAPSTPRSPPTATSCWWFDDTDGDEFGSWQVQPFGVRPRVGPRGTAHGCRRLPGRSGGRHVRWCSPGSPTTTAPASTWPGPAVAQPESSTGIAEDGGVGALSTDETLWVLSHSEHGDSRYPALRALSLPAGDVIGELSDAPGKGLAAMTFSPVAGRSAAAGRARAARPRGIADLGPDNRLR